MADNKNPNEKQPGEHKEGKFHYNPGNQAGKEVGIAHPEAEPDAPAGDLHSRDEPRKSA
jgi:hypothetical protein